MHGIFPRRTDHTKGRAMAGCDATGRPQTSSYIKLEDAIPRPEPAHLHTPLPNHTRYSIASCAAASVDSCCAPRVRPKKSEGLRDIMFSKTTRISILLGIDTAFFLLELTVGKWSPRLRDPDAESLSSRSTEMNTNASNRVCSPLACPRRRLVPHAQRCTFTMRGTLGCSDRQ